jgi:hypothetical protein
MVVLAVGSNIDPEEVGVGTGPAAAAKVGAEGGDGGIVKP